MALASGDAIRDFDLNLFQQPAGYIQLQQKYCKLKSQLTLTKKKIVYTSKVIEKYGQVKYDLQCKEREVFALKEECMKACINYKAESERLANIEKENENLRKQCSTAEEENKIAHGNFIQSESKNEALYCHIKQLQHLLNEREEKIASMKIELSLSSSSVADMKQRMCKYVRAINKDKMSNKQIMEIFDNFVDVKDFQCNMDEVLSTSNEVRPKKLCTNVILQLENTLSMLESDANTENLDNVVKILCKSKRNKQICLKLLCLLRDISDKCQDHDSDVYSDVNSEDFDSCSLDIAMDNVPIINKHVDIIAIDAKHKQQNNLLFDRNEICGEACYEGSDFDALFGTPTHSIDTGCGSSLTSSGTKNLSPEYITNSPTSTDSGLFKSLSKAASVATSPASEFLVDKSTNTNWLPVDQATNTSLIVCHKSTSTDNLMIKKIKFSDKAINTNGSRHSDKAINTDESRLTTSYVSNLEVEDILDTMTLRFNMLSPLPPAPPVLIETSTQTQILEFNKNIVKYFSHELRAEKALDLIKDHTNVFMEDTPVCDNDESLNIIADIAHDQNDHSVPADNTIRKDNTMESISIATGSTMEQQSELYDIAETNITQLQDINTSIAPNSNILNFNKTNKQTISTHKIKDSDVKLRKTSPKITKQKQRKSMVSKTQTKKRSSLPINFLQDLLMSDDETDNQEPLRPNEGDSNTKCGETNLEKMRPKMTKLQSLRKSITQIQQCSLSSRNLLHELMSEKDTNNHLKHNKCGNDQSLKELTKSNESDIDNLKAKDPVEIPQIIITSIDDSSQDCAKIHDKDIQKKEAKEPQHNVISQLEITISNELAKADNASHTQEYSELSNCKDIKDNSPLKEVAIYNSINIEAVLQDQLVNLCKKSNINNNDDNSNANAMQKETEIVTEDHEDTVKENNNVISLTQKTKCRDMHINPAPNNCEILRKEPLRDSKKISTLKHSESKNTVNNEVIKESNMAHAEFTKDPVSTIPKIKTINKNYLKIDDSGDTNKNMFNSETLQKNITQFRSDITNSVPIRLAITGNQQSKSLENGKLNQPEIKNSENNYQSTLQGEKVICTDSSFENNSLDTIEERQITRKSTKKKITKLQKIKKALVPKSKIKQYLPLPRKVCLNQLKLSGDVAKPIETNCTSPQIKEKDAYQKALEIALELRIKQKENCNRKFKTRSSLKPSINVDENSSLKLLDNKKELKVYLQRLTEADIADIINSVKSRALYASKESMQNNVNTYQQIKRKRNTSATLEPECKRILRSRNSTQNATLYNTNNNVHIGKTTITRNTSKIQEEKREHNENEISKRVTRLSQSRVSSENIINESHNINTCCFDAVSETRKLRRRPKTMSFTSEGSDNSMSLCRRSLRNNKPSEDKINLNNISKPEISNKTTCVRSQIGCNNLDLFGDWTPPIITSTQISEISPERSLSTIVSKHNSGSRDSIKSYGLSLSSVESECSMNLRSRSSNSFEANNNSLMVTSDQESSCKRLCVAHVERQDFNDAENVSKKEQTHPIAGEQSSKPNIVTYNDIDLFSDKSNNQPDRGLWNMIVNNKKRIDTNDVGYFYKMLEQHCGTQTYKKPSKSVTESSVDDIHQKLEVQIGSITDLPDKDVVNAISPLAEYISSVNRKVFLSAIIKYLMSANRESDIQCRKYTPPVPPMTKQEQVLLYILCHLRGAWPDVDVFGDLLRCIQFTLFRLNHSPEFKQVESLSHFYAVVCRYMRAQSHLRSFMVDALYCMSFKAIPIIKQCLDVWMHVLPLAHLSMAKDPLVLCIVFLLQFYTCEDKFNRVQPLRQTLVKTYFYNMADWNETKILMYLKSCLMDVRGIPAEKKNLRMCLIILAKRKGVTWCQKNIVDNMILPIVNDTKVDARVRQFCVTIIGPIMRPYPKNMKINCEIAIDRLLSILAQKCPHEMQEAVFSSLIYLSKHNVMKVTNALLSWRPQRRVSPELDQLIIDYIKERSPRKWLHILTKN